MRPSRLGRGLASLIHEVPPAEEPTCNPSPAILWPVEHPEALTPAPLRLSAREALEKLSTRPAQGMEVARTYLDHLRQMDARTHISLDLPPGVDLTASTMLQLTRERITNSVRHSFLGLVSIWK